MVENQTIYEYLLQVYFFLCILLYNITRGLRMKGDVMIYIFLAPGFEEIEAIVPRDILKRANVDVSTVGIEEQIVESTKGLKLVSDITINDISDENLDGIILPGGMPGTSNLEKCEKLIDIIKTCAKKNLLIAAICAAPSILGKLGILSGKDACCFPDAEIEKYLTGAKINNKDVNVCENIITSKGPGTAFQFAFSIVEYLRGNQVRQNLSAGIQFSK